MATNNTEPKKTLFRRPTLRSEDAEEFFGNLLQDEKEIDELLYEKELFDALEEHEKDEGAVERRDTINRRLSFLNNKLDSSEIAELLLDDEFLLDLKEKRKQSSKGSPSFDPALSTSTGGLSSRMVQRLSLEKRASLIVRRLTMERKLDLGHDLKNDKSNSSKEIF